MKVVVCSRHSDEVEQSDNSFTLIGIAQPTRCELVQTESNQLRRRMTRLHLFIDCSELEYDGLD